MADRKFLGIDKEIDFLEISKNRKLEIENIEIVENYRSKISGFSNKDEMISFLLNESPQIYYEELKF